MASLVEALDLLGRAHTLQSQTIEPGDARAVETRKDATMTLSSATRRWFSERTWSSDSIGLTIVRYFQHIPAALLRASSWVRIPLRTSLTHSKQYTTPPSSNSTHTTLSPPSPPLYRKNHIHPRASRPAVPLWH